MSLDLRHELELLHQRATELRFGEHPNELYEPLRYMMNLGGKRMRPLLVLLGAYLYSDDYRRQATDAALAVEVFHNFTLLHDDIMDNAPLRRGMPTVHSRWNSNIAILSGDVMLVRAYDLMLGIAPHHLRHLLARFNRTASEVCEGQQLDMNFETCQTVTEAQYIEMIRLKTAVLLGFALEMGAILGGSSDVQADLLRCFGTDLGIGFQLKDDLLDVYGEQAKVGKQVGGDILSNKKTFLLLTAIARAQGPSAERLQQWLAFQPANDPQKAQKVQGVMALYAELGVREAAEAKMHEYFDRAFEHLAAVQANADRKQFLEQFAREIVGRDR